MHAHAARMQANVARMQALHALEERICVAYVLEPEAPTARDAPQHPHAVPHAHAHASHAHGAVGYVSCSVRVARGSVCSDASALNKACRTTD